MQGDVCHAGSHSGLLCAFIINGKYWLCLNLNYDFWSVIGKPHSYIDLSLIRHWYLDQEHVALRRSGPRPQLATFMKTSCAWGCLLRRALACSKIVTKCYYFWHQSRGSRAFNCSAQEQEDKHRAPYKPGTWIGRRVQVGKCAVLYLESS